MLALLSVAVGVSSWDRIGTREIRATFKSNLADPLYSDRHSWVLRSHYFTKARSARSHSSGSLAHPQRIGTTRTVSR
ncbi:MULTISPECIES: hypothetical protein [Aerosakkonema]|uniref:hypothetical protein n=1 Tax=Aerosakkonema TaxID=1246629 RepID=UPI0035B8093A